MISLIQHFEADFLWKVSLKILNSGIIIILIIFTHFNSYPIGIFTGVFFIQGLPAQFTCSYD